MRIAKICAGSALVALAAAACTQDRTLTGTTPTDPSPKPVPRIIGVYNITITGIGTDQMSATAEPARLPTPAGVSPSLTPITSGLVLEAVSTGSFSDGSRTGGGERYLTSTFRVRNATAGALDNVTFMMASTGSSINGTAISVLRKFDNTNADPAIAPLVTPTGAVTLGGDLTTMLSPYPDVLQVYTEAEAATIPTPAGVTTIFPFGFIVRNRNSTTTRQLPSAAADANQYDGLMTVAFRVPMQSSAANDVFSLSFQAVAISASDVLMTESIEESQDTAAVRRLRDRATALGATTVTVLNGSPAMDPAVPDYPGQRQICSFRVAGPQGAPTSTNVSPAGYSGLMVLNPGESMDPCAAYFRTGTAGRPATNVPFTVTVKAVDRYGNVKTAQADTVHLSSAGPANVVGSTQGLVSGSAPLTITYTNYGTATLTAVGKRLTGFRVIPVAGVVRTWTAGAGTTDWNTANNWSPAAVPMNQDSVYIPLSAPLDPVLASNVSVLGVTVEDQATISLGAFDLTAGGSVLAGLNGGITNTSGRLFLSGVGQTVTGRLPTVRVSPGATYSATTGSQGNINSRAPVQVDGGRLTISGVRLQVDSN